MPEPGQPAAAGQVWEQIVEFAKAKGNLPTSEKRSCVPLRLQMEPPADPKQRPWPHKSRNVAEIEPALREAIRGLVSGVRPWPLYLHGPTGTGKTCAALCLCDHCGGSWFMTTERLASEWVDVLCSRYDDGKRKVGAADYRKRITDRPLVVIDDCGAREKVSDTHYEVIKLVLDLREGKPLVVTSNHNLETIARLYDARIADRLTAGTVLELAGESRRRT